MKSMGADVCALREVQVKNSKLINSSLEKFFVFMMVCFFVERS